jgi:hypothetical protein
MFAAAGGWLRRPKQRTRPQLACLLVTILSNSAQAVFGTKQRFFDAIRKSVLNDGERSVRVVGARMGFPDHCPGAWAPRLLCGRLGGKFFSKNVLLFQPFPLQHIKQKIYMFEAVNIGKKLLIIQLCCTSHDKYFEPNYPMVG